MSDNKSTFNFKDFIYLDTDFLKSFISQKYLGFPDEIHSTLSKGAASEAKGAKESKESDLSGNVGVPPFGVIGNKKTTTEGGQVNESNTKTFQNTMITSQKENMFNSFWEYVEENSLWTKAENPITGKYFILSETFNYIDFTRIQKLCSEHYRSNYNNLDNVSAEDLNEIEKKVSILQEIIPFDTLLCNKKYIVLIDKTWLKIKPDYLGYIWSKKVTIIGRISKSLQIDNEMPKIIKILNEIQRYGLSLLEELGLESFSEEAYIVLPMAIYL